MAVTKEMRLGFKAIAENLIEFGYPDITGEMIEDVYIALKDGSELPHGVIGMFAGSQIYDHPEIFGLDKENK